MFLKINFIFDPFPCITARFFPLFYPVTDIIYQLWITGLADTKKTGYCRIMHPVWSRIVRWQTLQWQTVINWVVGQVPFSSSSWTKCLLLLRAGVGESKMQCSVIFPFFKIWHRSFFLGKKKRSYRLHTKRRDCFKFSLRLVLDFDNVQGVQRLHRLVRVRNIFPYPLL